MSKKEDLFEMRGVIDELLPGAKFRVKLQNDHEIMAHMAGKLRLHKIRLGVGDEVVVQMSAYDLSKGRITVRL